MPIICKSFESSRFVDFMFLDGSEREGKFFHWKLQRHLELQTDCLNKCQNRLADLLHSERYINLPRNPTCILTVDSTELIKFDIFDSFAIIYGFDSISLQTAHLLCFYSPTHCAP